MTAAQSQSSLRVTSPEELLALSFPLKSLRLPTILMTRFRTLWPIRAGIAPRRTHAIAHWLKTIILYH